MSNHTRRGLGETKKAQRRTEVTWELARNRDYGCAKHDIMTLATQLKSRPLYSLFWTRRGHKDLQLTFSIMPSCL